MLPAFQIVNDNMLYAKVVVRMGVRTECKNCDFSDILEDEDVRRNSSHEFPPLCWLATGRAVDRCLYPSRRASQHLSAIRDLLVVCVGPRA